MMGTKRIAPILVNCSLNSKPAGRELETIEAIQQRIELSSDNAQPIQLVPFISGHQTH